MVKIEKFFKVLLLNVFKNFKILLFILDCKVVVLIFGIGMNVLIWKIISIVNVNSIFLWMFVILKKLINV